MSTQRDKAGMEGFGSCLFLLGVLVAAVTVGAILHGVIGAILAFAVILVLLGALFVWAAQ